MTKIKRKKWHRAGIEKKLQCMGKKRLELIRTQMTPGEYLLLAVPQAALVDTRRGAPQIRRGAEREEATGG